MECNSAKEGEPDHPVGSSGGGRRDVGLSVAASLDKDSIYDTFSIGSAGGCIARWFLS